MSLQHEHILNPITALAFYQRPDGPLLILAGEGSFLKILEAENSKLLSQCEVFDDQAIHGIITTETTQEEDAQVLIWGGTSLNLFKKSDFERLLAQDSSNLTQEAFEASDWILDAAFSPLDSSCCVLITAHNTLLRARLNTPLHVTFETVASPARSILYSAHLVVEPSGEVLAASGTVFGEIIVWSYSATGVSQVLFTFTGHEGSIFGVNISPPLTIPDKRQIRLLASCSDDRTIRVWDLTIGSSTCHVGDKRAVVRETGFGQNNDDQNQSENRCVATVMAHASRIWRVKFLLGQENPHQFPSVNVLSFGEDSTTQQWNFDIRSNVPSELGHSVANPSRLTPLKACAFHNGKHIWSTALHHGASRTMLATGGADGKISLLELAFPGNRCPQQPIASDETRLQSSGSSGPGPGGANVPATMSTLGLVPGTREFSSWDLEEDILKYMPSFQTTADQTTSEPTGPELPESELDTATTVLEPDVTKSPQLELDGKPPKKKKTKKIIKDVFNKYTFVSESQLLFTTTSGRVVVGKIGETTPWEELMLPRSATLDLKSYSVVHGVPEIRVAYLAGANGNIYTFAGGPQLLEVGKVDGKVADMFTIFDPNTSSFDLLVTTLAGKVATLFSIRSVPIVPDLVGQFHQSKEYRISEKFIVTSAGRIGDLLICGSRSGSLLVFDTKEPAAFSTEQKFPFLAGDAITTIIPLPATTNSSTIPATRLEPNVPDKPGQSKVSGPSYFLTTGRNGIYAIFTARRVLMPNANVPSVTINCVHVGSLPFGPMIEAAWFQGPDQDLLLYGFKSKNFIVWNETKQFEIANVDCGGAHRSYAYSPSGSGGHFAYTKASRLYIHSQREPNHAIVKKGGHGREIKACTVSKDGNFVVTGAEDTTILIWSYDDEGSLLDTQFRCQAILQKHTAGIQYIHWHQTLSGTNYLFSSGGNEEFFIWSIEPIPGGIGVVCEATYPDQSQEHDLRIMSLDVTDIDGGMMISLAYSDSTIRTYTYSKNDGFKSVTSGRYTTACLTKIRHLELVSGEEVNVPARLGHQELSYSAEKATSKLDLRNNARKSTSTQYLSTAATDGNLSLWSILLVPESQGQSKSIFQSSNLTLLGTHKIHQSSIKSLDIIKYNNSFLVVTGGDDNAIGILIYSTTNHVIDLVPKRYILSSTHAAAITGLCILPRMDEENVLRKRGNSKFIPGIVGDANQPPDIIKVVSSGNDQRVKEWHVKLSTDEENGVEVVGIENTSDRFTSVADVGDMAVLRNGAGDVGDSEAGDELREQKILIVGNGMEVWKV
ncbi:related to WD repeat protein WDR6 [Phialocephala subalpina]|uniref:Related to WD repeat protein WDR6 n=1 Tax=Phialocephala subalpina TaxID=576137 RepID=A0A1L7WTD2_9HELO|nr:related to WD repeat protein WDR6 [Phialocephala subalpina]